MAMCFSSWNEEGGICGVGDKHCAICGSGDGGCLAAMHEDLFSLASERQLVERLNEGKYPNYKQLMIDTLKKIYNHEYTEIEELKPLPKQLNCCTSIRSICDTCRKVFVCPMQHIEHRKKCGLYEPLPNPLDEIVTETRSLNPIKEEKSMESAERIEITFKSGETISYGKGEWDDYAYDGKAVIVKQKGAWIGIYNFDHVFCVELKEK